MIDTQTNYLSICIKKHLALFSIAAEGNPNIQPSAEKISRLVAEVFFGMDLQFESSREFLAELILPVTKAHIAEYLKGKSNG